MGALRSVRWLPPILLSALLILAAGPVLAAGAPQRFPSGDHVMQWVHTYRQKPTPARLPAAVRTLAETGALSDEESAAVHIGFIAGVIGDNQMKAGKLIKAMMPLPPDAQSALIKAVAYSGLPNWREILNDSVGLMPERRVLIDKLILSGQPNLMALPVDEGRTLDMLWGYYLATGYYQPVQRIISVLPWAEDKNDLDKLVVGSMAKWTLASNGSKNQALLELYKAEAAMAQPTVATPLKEIVNAVEIAEIGQIKKQAHAAIEELKIKGPASKRTTAWAAELGATAIALGCVVAGVTGQVQLGIPCIITGAATQAAGKILTSDSWSAKSLGFGN